MKARGLLSLALTSAAVSAASTSTDSGLYVIVVVRIIDIPADSSVTFDVSEGTATATGISLRSLDAADDGKQVL